MRLKRKRVARKFDFFSRSISKAEIRAAAHGLAISANSQSIVDRSINDDCQIRTVSLGTRGCTANGQRSARAAVDVIPVIGPHLWKHNPIVTYSLSAISRVPRSWGPNVGTRVPSCDIGRITK